MHFWTMMIYAAAAAIAVQGLFALMTAHRQNSLQKYFAEESQKHAEKSSESAVTQKQEAA